MAHITIVFSDNEDGSVGITGHPNVQQHVDLEKPDANLSPAEAYAVHVMRVARQNGWPRGARRDRQTVTVTLEDRENGGVTVVSAPTMSFLDDRRKLSGLTSAQTCAAHSLLSLRLVARKQQLKATGIILLPPRLRLE